MMFNSAYSDSVVLSGLDGYDDRGRKTQSPQQQGNSTNEFAVQMVSIPGGGVFADDSLLVSAAATSPSYAINRRLGNTSRTDRVAFADVQIRPSTPTTPPNIERSPSGETFSNQSKSKSVVMTNKQFWTMVAILAVSFLFASIFTSLIVWIPMQSSVENFVISTQLSSSRVISEQASLLTKSKATACRRAHDLLNKSPLILELLGSENPILTPTVMALIYSILQTFEDSGLEMFFTCWPDGTMLVIYLESRTPGGDPSKPFLIVGKVTTDGCYSETVLDPLLSFHVISNSAACKSKIISRSSNWYSQALRALAQATWTSVHIFPIHGQTPLFLRVRSIVSSFGKLVAVTGVGLAFQHVLQDFYSVVPDNGQLFVVTGSAPFQLIIDTNSDYVFNGTSGSSSSDSSSDSIFCDVSNGGICSFPVPTQSSDPAIRDGSEVVLQATFTFGTIQTPTSLMYSNLLDLEDKGWNWHVVGALPYSELSEFTRRPKNSCIAILAFGILFSIFYSIWVMRAVKKTNYEEDALREARSNQFSKEARIPVVTVALVVMLQGAAVAGIWGFASANISDELGERYTMECVGLVNQSVIIQMNTTLQASSAVAAVMASDPRADVSFADLNNPAVSGWSLVMYDVISTFGMEVALRVELPHFNHITDLRSRNASTFADSSFKWINISSGGADLGGSYDVSSSPPAIISFFKNATSSPSNDEAPAEYSSCPDIVYSIPGFSVLSNIDQVCMQSSACSFLSSFTANNETCISNGKYCLQSDPICSKTAMALSVYTAAVLFNTSSLGPARAYAEITISSISSYLTQLELSLMNAEHSKIFDAGQGSAALGMAAFSENAQDNIIAATSLTALPDTNGIGKTANSPLPLVRDTSDFLRLHGSSTDFFYQVGNFTIPMIASTALDPLIPLRKSRLGSGDGNLTTREVQLWQTVVVIPYWEMYGGVVQSLYRSLPFLLAVLTVIVFLLGGALRQVYMTLHTPILTSTQGSSNSGDAPASPGTSPLFTGRSAFGSAPKIPRERKLGLAPTLPTRNWSEKQKMSYDLAIFHVQNAVAGRSLRHFNLSKKHMFVFSVVHHRLYITMLMLTIAVHMSLAIWEPPTTHNSKKGLMTLLIVEICCIMVYIADLLAQAYHTGPRRLLRMFTRSSSVHILAFAILVFIMLVDTLVAFAVVNKTGSSSRRISRVLRPCLLFARVDSIRSAFILLMRSLIGFVDMLTLLASFLCFFSIFGMTVFRDAYSWSSDTYGAWNLLESLVTHFHMLTQEPYPGVLTSIYNPDSISGVVGPLYYTFISMTALTFIVPSIIAIFYELFKAERMNGLLKKRIKEISCLIAAFDVLDREKNDELEKDTFLDFMVYLLQCYRGKHDVKTLLKIENEARDKFNAVDVDGSGTCDKEEFCDLLRALFQRLLKPPLPDDSISAVRRWVIRVFFVRQADRYNNIKLVPRLLFSSITTIVVALNIVINTIDGVVYIEAFDSTYASVYLGSTDEVQTATITFFVYYIIEIAIKLCAYTAKGYWRQGAFERFNLVVVLISLIAFSVGNALSLSQTFIRVFSVLPGVRIFTVVERTAFLMQTFFSVMPAVTNVFLLTFAVQYLFALIGIEIFNAMPTPDTMPPYARLGDDWVDLFNFNLGGFRSFMSAMYTMYQMFLACNYGSIIFPLVRYSGSQYHLLFIVYIFVVYMILANLFVGLVLDAFIFKLRAAESVEGERKLWIKFNKKPVSMRDQVCFLCGHFLEDESTQLRPYNCGHNFHTLCVMHYEYRRGECPRCRTDNCFVKGVVQEEEELDLEMYGGWMKNVISTKEVVENCSKVLNEARQCADVAIARCPDDFGHSSLVMQLPVRRFRSDRHRNAEDLMESVDFEACLHHAMVNVQGKMEQTGDWC